MSVVPLRSPLTLIAPQPCEVDSGPEENENRDPVTKCGRCRINFVRHPSISPDDSAKWWLCPPCRSRLLGDVTKTSARWSS
jgi:hypothetical protein